MQRYGNLEIIQNKTVSFFDFCNNLCAHYDIMSVVAVCMDALTVQWPAVVSSSRSVTAMSS